MQPLLVLAFLYVLSNATTLDKLIELAKKEVNVITHHKKVGETGKPLSFDAPGFIMPLYKVPKPYETATDEDAGETNVLLRRCQQRTSDNQYYCDCHVDNTIDVAFCPPSNDIVPFAGALDLGTSVLTSSDPTGTEEERSLSYFSMRQRILWRKEVFNRMLKNFQVCIYEEIYEGSTDNFQGCLVDWRKADKLSLKAPGELITIDYAKNNAPFNLNSDTLQSLRGSDVNKIIAYLDPPALVTPPSTKPEICEGTIPVDKRTACVVYKLLDVVNNGFYPAGSKNLYRGIKGLVEYEASTSFNSSGIDESRFTDFIEAYNKTLGVDDGDALRGEPRNLDQPNGEFPPCLKHCPTFDPGYDAEGPVSQPAGSTTPVAIRNPTLEMCTSFCMYISEDEESRFSYIVGAIMVWIVLNVMAGAFVTMIPQLAKYLSDWQNYASAVPSFTGKSKSMSGVTSRAPGEEVKEEDLGGYSQTERDGMYTLGAMGKMFTYGISRTKQEIEGKPKQVKRRDNGDYYIGEEDKYKDPFYVQMNKSLGILGVLFGGTGEAEQNRRNKAGLVALGQNDTKTNWVREARNKLETGGVTDLSPEEKKELYQGIQGEIMKNKGKVPYNMQDIIEKLVRKIMEDRGIK